MPISCTWRAERRQTIGVGNPGADGGYRVALSGLGVSMTVETPADALDCRFSLKLPKPMVGYAQRFKLAWTKEMADAGFVKGVLIELDRHGISIMSAFR